MKVLQSGEMFGLDLFVGDLNQAVDFYGGVFDWSFQQVDNEVAHFSVHGITLGAFSQKNSGHCWVHKIIVSNLDEAKCTVLANGGKKSHLKVSGEEIEVFEDPLGSAFGISESRRVHEIPVKHAHGAPLWPELHVRNLEESCHFYSKVFNYEMRPIHHGRVPTVELSVEGVGVGSIRETEGQEGWMMFISVDSISKVEREIEQKGGKCLEKPQTMLGVGTYGLYTDPFGNLFGICEAVKK